MKGKIFVLLFSLIALASHSQTINGRLYTQFNNYYKWRGGAFDSVLLLPNLTGTAGLRGGALRYNGADSSLYVYTGTQWQKIGGGSGSTPTLQQVTDQGNSTTDSINIIASSGERVGIFTKLTTGSTSGLLMLRNSFNPNIFTSYFPTYVLFNKDGYRTVLSYSNITKNNDVNIPDSSGTLPLRVKLNSTTYAPANNGTIDLGATDTATVVKAYVTNAESVTITKGQVVYIFGASGDRASVKLAKNTSDTFSSKTLGIVREDIAAGQTGWITTQGQVSGINLSAYTPGDILWLDSIPGSFTSTKPQAPYHAVFLGVVERANVGNGLIYVKPQNGVELDELHDVRITSLANNDVIRYNSSLGYWENKSIETTSGVQWQGVDSTFAYQQVRNGYHEVCEFVAGVSVAQLAAIPNSAFFVGGGATSASATTEANTYGLINLTTTGIVGVQSGYLLHGQNTYLPSTDTLVQSYRFKINNLSDSTGGASVYNFYVGNSANPNTTIITDGILVLYNRAAANFTGANGTTVWQFMTANSSSRTVTNSSVTVATGWNTIVIRSTSNWAQAMVNGVAIATHTNNIPSAAIRPIFSIRNASGTLRAITIDNYSADIKYLTPR
jgi:hypothetical protein